MDRETIPDWVAEEQAAIISNARERLSRWIGKPFGTAGRIRYYPRGVRLEADQVAKTRTSGNTGKRRGRIGGWSAASRRRMREWMLEHRPKGDCIEACVTLTVPGPVLTPEEVRGLWRRVTVYLPRIGVSCVWRLEVQKRGAAHWHCLMHRPLTYRRAVASLNEPEFKSEALRIDLRKLWSDALDALGEVEHTTERFIYRAKRSGLPGAFEPMPGAPYGRALDFRLVDESVIGWLRYMQDHATKAKQEQEAAGLGRHWGVIGQKLYEVNETGEGQRLARTEYVRLLRVLRKWNRMRIRNRGFEPGSVDPWQTHLGYETGRGRRGASVWFGNPEVYRKAVGWARRDLPCTSKPAGVANGDRGGE